MTLEKVIKYVEAVAEEQEKEAKEWHKIQVSRQLAEWLKELKQLKEQTRWIPVSEKLPKEKGLYLVSVKNDHERRYSKTCWYEGRNNWFARQDVLAWQPLPQPYKAESDIRGCDNRDAFKIIERSLCDSCTNIGCMFQSGIVRKHCDFYKAEREVKK